MKKREIKHVAKKINIIDKLNNKINNKNDFHRTNQKFSDLELSLESDFLLSTKDCDNFLLNVRKIYRNSKSNSHPVSNMMTEFQDLIRRTYQIKDSDNKNNTFQDSEAVKYDKLNWIFDFMKEDNLHFYLVLICFQYLAQDIIFDITFSV